MEHRRSTKPDSTFHSPMMKFLILFLHDNPQFYLGGRQDARLRIEPISLMKQNRIVIVWLLWVVDKSDFNQYPLKTVQIRADGKENAYHEKKGFEDRLRKPPVSQLLRDVWKYIQHQEDTHASSLKEKTESGIRQGFKKLYTLANRSGTIYQFS